MSHPRKIRLGDILIARGLLKAGQLDQALGVQRKSGELLGRILVRLGFLREIDVVAALVIQCAVPYIAIDLYPPNPAVIPVVPADLARKRQVVPLDRVGEVLSVVMENPFDEKTLADLRQRCGCQIAPFISTPTAIAQAIARYYPE